mgnify:CR=1 FL=1
MQIETLSLGPIGTNCYIISKNDHCLIVDPGGDAHLINEYLAEQGVKPEAILLTHAHYDHIGAVDELRKQYQLDVYLHEREQEWLENPQLNRSFYAFGASGAITTTPPEKIVEPGTLSIGPFTMKVVHTPGHSPGSVTYIFDEERFVVSGDVLFYQGIGRTDLPEGSIEQLANSIAHELYVLPDDFQVYPGHGPSTTIGDEKITNPFTLQFYRE